MMPGLDGMATLKALKALRPETQVIMLSGRNQASTIVEAVRLGAADYVVKPNDPEGLGEIALDVAIKNAIEKNRLVSELSELRQQLSDDEDRTVWGHSDKMRGIATVIEQVADSDVTVLLRGESGVGKELVCARDSSRSTRHNRPFVKVNCAALPAELLESELFGHERGAFTGAATTRIGKFEQADGGTLMLDEIGEMKPALQAKLLHVLQDGEFTKLGSNKRIQVDVRIVAATNRDLETDADERRVPRGPLLPAQGHRPARPGAARAAGRDRHPLRLLCRPLLAKVQPSRQAGLGSAPSLFMQYEWPGNIRELENMIKRIVILQDEQLVVHEIERNIQRAMAVPAPAAPAYAVAGVGAGSVGVGNGCRCRRCTTFRLPRAAPDVELPTRPRARPCPPRPAGAR